MPKGYIIAHVSVTDTDTYQRYVAKNLEIFTRHGGKYLVRGGAHELPEGPGRSRHVVIEFPSFEAAKAAYGDPEYTEHRKLRWQSADSDVVLAEGAP